MSEFGESRVITEESETNKSISKVVEALELMGGKKEETTHGDTYYNILERHTNIDESKALYAVLLGTMTDTLDSYSAGTLKKRKDLARTMIGGWASHYYQARISLKGKGREQGIIIVQSGTAVETLRLESLSGKSMQDKLFGWAKRK